MKVKPLGSKVLLKRVRLDAQSAGGVIIPETARKKRPSEGIVVLAGPDVDDLAPDSRVFFERYAGTELELDGEPHLLVEYDEIDGVMDEAA